MRKLFIFILLAWVFILSASADLSIIVRPNESWKNMQTNEIETLCTNVALHFQEQLRDEHKIKGKKLIIDFGGPQILLKSWEPETHYIFLSVNGAYWQQLTYQFAHEFCHVLHKHENFGIGHPNKWFYESISMAASLWALREMEKTWEYRPPYPNWAGWRQNLGEYADQNKNRDGVQYSGTAPEWLKKWEIFLRDDSKNTFTHHLLVAQLSFKFFLPIFEKNPEVWNAVAQMPTSRSEISQYMKEWYDTVDPQDKRVVQAMAEVMGIDVDSPIPIVDVMNSGLPLTFTHAANALVPINGIDEWDGWTQGIWEKRPDGTTTRKSGAYFDFPEMDRWEHWMYAHAPSVLKFDISEIEPTRFSAFFGLLNPGCGGGASVQIFVRADDIHIYQSKQMLYVDEDRISVAFNIPQTTKMLTIEISDLRANGCDHYVFGEPKLFFDTDIVYEASKMNRADVDKNGIIDLSDVLLVRSAIQNPMPYDTDVNNDGITDEIDLRIVKEKATEAIAAAAPSLKRRRVITTTWGALKKQ